MRFRHYDSLHVFTHVARYGSFSAAADSLSLTKGAISHQIRLLESVLGFPLFHRQSRGIALTGKGEALLAACLAGFTSIDETIEGLRTDQTSQLTLGVTTYFASRWLSQKLMHFMQLHPDVRLRLQPMVDLSDLEGEGIDLAIRWGNGNWAGVDAELLFCCPAWPCGDKKCAATSRGIGCRRGLRRFYIAPRQAI